MGMTAYLSDSQAVVAAVVGLALLPSVLRSVLTDRAVTNGERE